MDPVLGTREPVSSRHLYGFRWCATLQEIFSDQVHARIQGRIRLVQMLEAYRATSLW